MSNLLKQYIKGILIELDAGSSRKSRSEDWRKALEKLNAYLQVDGLKFFMTNAAKSGSTAADITGNIVDISTGKVVSGPYNLEVKSFGADTKFKIEMTNPQSATRLTVLKTNSSLGTVQDVEEQLTNKLFSAGGRQLVNAVKMALSSKEATVVPGKFIIQGSPEKRGIYVQRGEINDWNRVKAVGSSGTARPFYTVPNEKVREAEKEMFYTDEVEQSIQDDFSSSGDDVLLICGPGCSSVRCFSLTSKAFKAFGFPMFASNGNTVKEESTKSMSFGGGGRIGLAVELLDDSGTII